MREIGLLNLQIECVLNDSAEKWTLTDEVNMQILIVLKHWYMKVIRLCKMKTECELTQVEKHLDFSKNTIFSILLRWHRKYMLIPVQPVRPWEL